MSPNISISRLARSTFCQRPIRIPPERRAFSPPRSLEEILASSKPVKTIAPGACCQPAEITGFPPDFNSVGSSCPRWDKPKLENFLETRSKTLFHVGSPRNPAQAEAEDSSKIKDRLEALLFAETLQGTLSPNANPGKGSVGGFQYWMPKAAAKIQRTAQTLIHLSSTRSFIPNCSGLRKGRIKKVMGCMRHNSEGRTAGEKMPDAIVRDAHPSKTAKREPTKVVVAQRWATPRGRKSGGDVRK